MTGTVRRMLSVDISLGVLHIRSRIIVTVDVISVGDVTPIGDLLARLKLLDGKCQQRRICARISRHFDYRKVVARLGAICRRSLTNEADLIYGVLLHLALSGLTFGALSIRVFSAWHR
jgi:hypothetical protein